MDFELLSFSFGSNEDDDINSKAKSNPTSKVEWLQAFRETYPKLSFLGLVFTIGILLYYAVPWGLLSFLPDAVVKWVVYLSGGGLLAWYGSTKRLRWDYSPPVDVIYQVNMAEEPSVKRWVWKKGKFAEEVEFKGGERAKPLVEYREDGQRIYTVLRFDPDELEAWGTWYGDIPEQERFKYREAIKAQRIYNDRQRRQAGKVAYAVSKKKSEAVTHAVNVVVRKMTDIKYPDSISDIGEDILPEEFQEDRSAKDLLQDMVQEEKSKEQLLGDEEVRNNGE